MQDVLNTLLIALQTALSNDNIEKSDKIWPS